LRQFGEKGAVGAFQGFHQEGGKRNTFGNNSVRIAPSKMNSPLRLHTNHPQPTEERVNTVLGGEGKKEGRKDRQQRAAGPPYREKKKSRSNFPGAKTHRGLIDSDPEGAREKKKKGEKNGLPGRQLKDEKRKETR